MADCDDRQLSEAQRQEGYQQGRTGVGQALRPFSGKPTLPNLLDYINRELVPAVRRTRDRLNDVYLPVVDSAPSGNPLTYYFSADTTNADPTEGRIRLNASPENTATVIRVSETNARLGDARPWLEVMAGGATTPLGVVTLSDAINPARFIRFDLDTMTDQGTYWDLAVTPIESSHDDPFPDGGGLVVAFIPGVASTGTTVPAGGLSPIGPNTVVGNPTASTAAPTEIAINALGVLGRKGLAGTGNLESIDVPDSTVVTGETMFLKGNSVRTALRFTNFTLADIPTMGNNKFMGNVSGATARPAFTDIAQLAADLFGIGFDTTTHNFRLTDALDNTFLGNLTGGTTYPRATGFNELDSVSITYENVSKSFVREALTGDVTALQNNNTVTINANAVTDAKLRDSGPLSVIGNATAFTADPADISAVNSSGAVLRESSGTLGFGTIATAGLADDSVTNAKIRNSGALSVIGRSANSSGDPADISATAASDAVLRESGSALGFGTVATGGIANDAVTDGKLRNSGALSVIGRSANSSGDPADISATAASGAVLRESGSVLGFGTIATAGIADDAVTNAKLANMAAGTVKGRAIGAGTGDPQDLTGAQVASLLRVSLRDTAPGGSDLTDYVPTASGIDDITQIEVDPSASILFNSLTAPSAAGKQIRITKLANSDQVTIVHEAAAGTAAMRFSCIGISTTPNIVLRHDKANVLVEYQDSRWRVIEWNSGIATTANAGLVTPSTSLVMNASAIERAALTGDVTASQNSNATTIANDAVTDAKLRNSGALSVIGRSANSSGDPADISATAASGAVLRESGSTLGFGTIATAGIADGAVTLAKMANLSQGTVIGRAATAGTGVPTALTGTQLGENLLIGTAVTDSTTTGAQAAYSFPAPSNNLIFSAVTVTLQGIVARSNGTIITIRHTGSGSTSLVHESGSAATADTISFGASAPDLVLSDRMIAVLLYQAGRWRVVGFSPLILNEDKGDITVTGTRGQTWTIDNNVVSDAKLRDSAALSVIGRASNSSGDPADIAAGADDRLLARTSSALSFTQLSDGMVPTNTLALTKLANILDNRFLGNISGATGAVTAVDFGSLNSTSIIYESTGKTLIRQALTGDVTASQNSNATTIANNAVTDGKLRDSGALSVIGRSANSTGDPADISGTASSDAVLRISGTSLGFGTVATAGIAANAVTNARLAQMTQSTIKGRAAAAGTGDPTDLTASQVVDILETTIEGRVMSWSAQQDFLGPTYFSGMIRLDGILSSSEGSSIDNKSIGQINIWRLNPTISPLLLNGMAPANDGQVVYITNTSTSNTIQVTDEGSSVAASRFALGTTAILIEPLRAYMFWYDGTDDRWKGFGNYPT